MEHVQHTRNPPARCVQSGLQSAGGNWGLCRDSMRSHWLSLSYQHGTWLYSHYLLSLQISSTDAIQAVKHYEYRIQPTSIWANIKQVCKNAKQYLSSHWIFFLLQIVIFNITTLIYIWSKLENNTMCCLLYTSKLHMSCIFQMLSLIYFTNENIEVNGVRKEKNVHCC